MQIQFDLTEARSGKAISKDNRRLIRFTDNDSSLPQFAKMSRLMMETGLVALHTFLHNQHSADQVTSWLAQPEVHKVLRRLRIREIVSETDWRLMYPNDKSSVAIDKFDLTLVILLVKYASNLRKPFPNGWTGPPRDTDMSSGAIIIRFGLLRRHLASVPSIDDSVYYPILRELRRYVSHFGGDQAKEAIFRIRKEGVADEEDQSKWLELFRSWHAREEMIAEREESLVTMKERRSADIPVLQSRIVSRGERHGVQTATPSRGGANAHSDKKTVGHYVPPVNANNRWNDNNIGMVTEEKNIMEIFYDRLIIEVKPDAIIDQLLNRKVINMEESNDVFSILKSQDQMKILIEILVRRSGNSFQEFINAIKARYTPLYGAIYSEYVKVMEQIKATKPEGVPYCKNMLTEHYDNVFRHWKPYPWYPEIAVDLETYYCPLQLFDLQGVPVELTDIFASQKNGTPVRSVCIEGDSGTGKSTFAKYLSLSWTKNPEIMGQSFELVFYIDLKISAVTLKIMMIEQLFGATFKLTEREMWEVVDDHQGDCLFILDGYEDNVNSETLDLIKGHYGAEVKIILVSLTKYTPQLKERYDKKLILWGFAKHKAKQYINNYIFLTKRPRDLFSGFLNKLSSNTEKNKEHSNSVSQPNSSIEATPIPVDMEPTYLEHNLTDEEDSKAGETAMVVPQKAGSLVPGTAIGFVYPSNEGTATNAIRRKEDIVIEDTAWNKKQRIAALRFHANVPLLCSFFCAMTDFKMSIDLTSWTAMIEQFLTAMKMKLIERHRENRFTVNKSYSQMAEIAIDSIKNGTSIVSIQDIENDKCLRQFGVLQEAVNLTMPALESRMYFPNRILQEYFAARALDMSGFDEASRFFQSNNLSSHVQNVAVFYCGLRRNDFETTALRALFNKVTELNRRLQQPLSFHDKTEKKVGNVMEYQFGLDCIALMDGRKDLSRTVVQTMPECVQVENKGAVPMLTVLGMAYIIDVNDSKVRELHIQLNQLSTHTPELYKKLARSIRDSANIETLRIIWEDRDLMTDFFREVCNGNKSLKTLELIDEAHKKPDKLPNKICGDIRQGAQNMKTIKHFAFRQCRHVALVNAVIKHLPYTLNEIDLSGCDINIIGSQDLSDKITKSREVLKIGLAGCRIEGMAFNAVIHSFSTNRSVIELNLSGVKLDNVCFFALAEALKANNKLDTLILTNTSVNLRSCEEIIQVMKINTTLRNIYLTEEKVPLQGRLQLVRNAKHVVIHGFNKKRSSTEDALATLTKF